MFQWVSGVMESANWAGIAFLMFLENVFPPIPSEIIMPLAGYLASQGKMSLVGAIIAGTIGSVLGSLPLYYAGRKLGHNGARKWAEKYGRWLTVSPEDIDKSREWMDKHGAFALCLGRLVPGVRSLIALPAGVDEISPAVFIGYTALGSAIWSGLLAGAGYGLGANFKNVDKWLSPLSYVVLALIVALYIYRFVKQSR
ncbi:MAG TPA: DedA family protein [Abditibacteriaceae bacterium]|jgi:membrane protein DedA with SNARE-associated domain